MFEGTFEGLGESIGAARSADAVATWADLLLASIGIPAVPLFPEPATLALLGAALVVAACFRRRRTRPYRKPTDCSLRPGDDVGDLYRSRVGFRPWCRTGEAIVTAATAQAGRFAASGSARPRLAAEEQVRRLIGQAGQAPTYERTRPSGRVRSSKSTTTRCRAAASC
jgi:hypothetical protein